MANTLLIVDDDTLLRRSLGFHLEQAGFRVLSAATAEDALTLVKRVVPDLILLDIGLPGMDGLEALKKLKFQKDIPIIFLTARRRELDEVLGLELGADDFITKPFDVDVVIARIKTVLRRVSAAHETPSTSPVEVGTLLIDPGAHTVNLSGKDVELSPREFDLLHALVLNAGQVVSTTDLLAQVWGAEFLGEPQVVYVHIRWLREKIEKDPDKPQRIVTVRGVGYKLMPEKF